MMLLEAGLEDLRRRVAVLEYIKFVDRITADMSARYIINLWLDIHTNITAQWIFIETRPIGPSQGAFRMAISRLHNEGEIIKVEFRGSGKGIYQRRVSATR